MNILFETKYALRLLRKTPYYTATCVLVTAVGIAVSLVAFTIIYTFSMKPLTYADSENWYSMMFSHGGGIPVSNTNAYFYQRILERDFDSFKVLGRQYSGSSVMSDREISVRFLAGYQSPSLMKATTVKPHLGRLFQAMDTEDSGPATVILSYPVWETFYNSDPEIVGKTTRLDGKVRTIVGVLPERYNLGFSHDIYLPPTRQIIIEPEFYGNGSPYIKLNENASVSAASQELNELLNALKLEYPDIYLDEYQLQLVAANQLSPGLNSIFVLMSMMAAIFVFFSCLNTGSLLFAHTLAKHRELIIRNALGSSRWQLVKQSLSESFFICFMGALLGVLLSAIVLLKIEAISATMFNQALVNNHHHFVLSLSPTSIVFVFAIVSFMWILSGILPVLKAVRQSAKAGPANSGKGSVNERSTKGAAALVGFQVAFTCFLLVISAIFIGIMDYFANRDMGINLDHKITAYVPLSDRYQSHASRLQYLQDLEIEVSDISNIESVAFATSLPSLQFQVSEYQLEDRSSQSPNASFSDPIAIVSLRYFDTAGIDLISGRNFESTDTLDSHMVAIVDQQFAERYWPGGSAIGKRLQVSPKQDGEWLTIIGVASHVLGSIRYAPDTAALIYRPQNQVDAPGTRMIAKYSGQYENVRSAIAIAASRVDRELPLMGIQPLDRFYTSSNAVGFMVMLSDLFFYIAIVTLFLATVGIFAVITRSILRQMQEMGIRRALGAKKLNIIWLQLKKGLIFLIVGCGVGLSLALLLLNGLFNSNSLQAPPSATPLPLIISSVVGCLAICIFLASYLPTRKAIAFEPGDALREE